MPIADIDYREYLTEDEVQKITGVFEEYDVSKTGSINEKELAVMFKTLGHKLSKRQLNEIINEVDYDSSGAIELDEFYVMNIKINKLWPRPDLISYRDYWMEPKIEKVKAAFQECDPEGNGYVEEADFVDHILEQLKIQAKDDFLDAVLKQALPEGHGRMDLDMCCSCAVVLSQARKRINYREFLTSAEVEKYRKLFQENDADKDDSVSLQELDKIMQRLGFALKGKQLKNAVKDFDLDESGEIDFEEFCVMMCRMKRKKRQRIISPESCSCSDLYRNERFTVKELFLTGFKLPHLRQAGVPARDIRKEGISALEFRRAGYTASELRRAGVNLTELRGAGYSLIDLRLAGFSDGSVTEANRTIRTSMSMGSLDLLAQSNPTSARIIYGKDDFLKSLPTNHRLRLMTPLIREHTDWNVFPDPPKKRLSKAGAQILGSSPLLEDPNTP